MNKKDFDWFEWAGIEPESRDKLLSEANNEGVPVFESDSNKDLYDRILASKTFKNNKSTIRMNKRLAVVTVISAAVSIAATIAGIL